MSKQDEARAEAERLRREDHGACTWAGCLVGKPNTCPYAAKPYDRRDNETRGTRPGHERRP